METQVLYKSRKIISNGELVEQVYITKKVARHKLNKDLGLEVGWVSKRGVVDCNPKCPAATALGYYDCIGGNCVFFPL